MWDVWLQSFVTLYAACVKELVPLMGQCPQTEPVLEDPHGAFITPAELRIQSLVRPSTHLHSVLPHHMPEHEESSNNCCVTREWFRYSTVRGSSYLKC